MPYDYSDLTGSKVRPALVVSSDAYNLVQRDVVAAGITSQLGNVGIYDHVLQDWATAGLRYPSLVRGRLLTIEQTLIRRTVGRISYRDWTQVEDKLASFLLSDQGGVRFVLNQVTLSAISGALVQALGEKSIAAGLQLANRRDPAIDLAQWRALLLPQQET
ncbi:MAG: type II toxin-antitoxin system PemK/MazF family toxin [Anaerolineae bacterium]